MTWKHALDRAHSLAQGCFTWADTSTPTLYQCTGVDAFTVRASGGVYFRTNASATAGVDLFGGASAWSAASDRALKENVVDVDASDILRRLVAMPIASWNYRAQDRAIRHVGPMAQDFHGAFGLGESDRHISTIDADGVALAAIQGLNAKLERMLRASDARIAELERQAGDLEPLARVALEVHIGYHVEGLVLGRDRAAHRERSGSGKDQGNAGQEPSVVHVLLHGR